MKTNKQTSSNKTIYEIRISNGDSYFLREELDYFLESNELIFVASHKNYKFPTNLEIDFSNFDSWEEIEKQLKKDGYKHIQPIYMYEHGMIGLSLVPFGCRFDSGRLGFIASGKKGRRATQAYKLYCEFIKDLEDYSNNNVKLIELYDEQGEVLESIECFGNREEENIAYLLDAFGKDAKIIIEEE